MLHAASQIDTRNISDIGISSQLELELLLVAVLVEVAFYNDVDVAFFPTPSNA